MKTMRLILIATVFLLALTACGGGGGSDASPSPKAITQPNIIAPTPTPDPGSDPGPIALTYYSLSKTVYPVNGFPATHGYTATAHCVVYTAQTYCWDDGLKTIQFSDFSGNHYGPFTYDYWKQNLSGQSLASCNGGCANDPLQVPTLVSNAVDAALTSAGINSVFSNGVAMPVTCTLTNSILSCVDFSIDLNQVSF